MIKEFYVCPKSGKPLVKREFVVCPHCGEPIVEKEEIRCFVKSGAKYCTNCGKEIASTLAEALAEKD